VDPNFPVPAEEPALDLGIVAVGRGAWREVLLGLQDGMASPSLLPEEEQIERDWLAWNERKRRHEKERKSEPGPEPVRPSKVPVAESNLETAPRIPPLGFIPYRNTLGWWNFPYRLVGWFNDRRIAREMGEAAFTIAMGLTRPMLPADEGLGYDSEERGRTPNLKEREWETVSDQIGLWPGAIERLRVFARDGLEKADGMGGRGTGEKSWSSEPWKDDGK
jgi:hypothetical protein